MKKFVRSGPQGEQQEMSGYWTPTLEPSTYQVLPTPCPKLTLSEMRQKTKQPREYLGRHNTHNASLPS